jgi:hypothetical protein
MTDYQPGYGSTYTKKSGQSNPENLLRRIRRENPKIDWDTEEKLFHDAVLDDPDMMRACANWVHVNAARNIERIDEAPTPQQAERRREAHKQETEHRQKRAAGIVYHGLFYVIGQMTFNQVASLARNAPNLKRIAKMGKPSENVLEVLGADKLNKELGRK